MKTITINGKTFEEAVYPIEIEPSIFAKRRNMGGVQRDTIRVTVTAAYADVAEAFVNNAEWSITEKVPNEDGTYGETVYDKSEYSVAGDIIDHRDGRITVYMAKPTETEAIRRDVEVLLPTLTDEMAATVPNLYPAFVVGKDYKTGERLSHGGVLYRVLQNHTSQADWTPDVAVSLFSKV